MPISSSPSSSPSSSISSSPSSSISSSPSSSPSSSISSSPSSSISSSPSSSISSSPSSSISASPSSGQITSNQNVSYLHKYYDTANRANYLLAVSNNGDDLSVKYRRTDLWGVVHGISTSWNGYADVTPDIENYLSRAFVVGYRSSDHTFLPNAVVNGITFSTTDANLTSMPQGKFLVRYKDLLYVLYTKTGGTVYPTRAYYCDEPTAGGITWNNLLTTFVEFGYDDGDAITGACEALNRLVVFKESSMWGYNESSVEKIAEIGCDSNRSIVKINKVLYWYNRDGFWRWRGSQPELISAKAKPYIAAMDQANTEDVVAVKHDGFEYRAFIGTVAVDGITYENAWFCWDTRRETCYIRCTEHPGKSCCVYTENGKRRAYFGDDDGYVYKFATKEDDVYSDNGYEIDSFFITKNIDYGAPDMLKTVNEINLFTKHAVGMDIAVDTDNKDEYNTINSLTIRKNIDQHSFLMGGNRFKYKFHEKGDGKSWEFEGFATSVDSAENWQ